ncbi:MAG: AIR synthase-related protein, partial [Oscillospiraceae bacterium]
GDLLIGLSSSGVHSNGFSLVRSALKLDEKKLNTKLDDLGCTLGEELLKPTRIYVKTILRLLKQGINVRAISHITGGGLYENVPRMMTEGLTAQIQCSAFPVLPIFDVIAKAGNIPMRDMYNTFNMGVGMVIAIPKEQVGDAMEVLVQAGERAYVIGTVVKGDEGVVLV